MTDCAAEKPTGSVNQSHPAADVHRRAQLACGNDGVWPFIRRAALDPIWPPAGPFVIAGGKYSIGRFTPKIGTQANEESEEAT